MRAVALGRLVALASVIVTAAACGDDAGPAGATPPAAPLACEPGSGVVGDHCALAGFEECPDGVGQDGSPCGEPKTSCTKGSVAFFGATACTPIGPGECPAGFSRMDDGLGCAPLLPAVACVGATRPRIGETTCVAVGDCAAAFPPAGATYFVDDSFTAGQLDATHFATIQAAVAAAPSGATIAIDEGVYTGTVTLPKAVTLVGRCAAKVTLSGGPAVATPGLEILSKVKTSFRGLTVTDFEVGVTAGARAEVTLEGVVLEANRRLGILGADAGTRIDAKNVVGRGTLPDGSGRFGHGAAAGFEGEVLIEDSAILDSSEIGAGAQKDGRLTVRRSVIQGVAQRKSNDAYGWGSGTQTGGQATLIESVILDTFAGGVVAAEAKSALRLERSYVRGVRTGPGSLEALAACAIAQQGSKLDIVGSTLSGSERYGVFVSEGATATMGTTVVRDIEGDPTVGAGIVVNSKSSITLTASAVVKSNVSGFLVNGTVDATDLFLSDLAGAAFAVQGTAKITRGLVTKLRAATGAEDELYGAGLFVSRGGSLEASEVLVRGAYGVGLLATGAGTKAVLRRAAITDVASPVDNSGYGIAGAGGAELTAEDVVVNKARDIAVHLSDPGTLATLRGVAIIDTQPGPAEGRARSINVQAGARATLTRVLTRGGKQVGLDVVGGEAVVEDSTFASVGMTKIGFGHGVVVTDAGNLVMKHSVVRDHAGIGFVFANAQGSIAASVVRGNPIAVHTQEGVSLVEASGAPEELTPLSVVFTTDTRFEENGSKTGSGEVPLPAEAKPPRSD